MIVLDLFPGGVIQLWDSIANGYWHARRLTFLMGGAYHKLEWLRMVGDMVFLFAGALPITLGALRSVWKRDLPPRRKGCTTPRGVCLARGVRAGSANGLRCPRDGFATD